MFCSLLVYLNRSAPRTVDLQNVLRGDFTLPVEGRADSHENSPDLSQGGGIGRLVDIGYNDWCPEPLQSFDAPAQKGGVEVKKDLTYRRNRLLWCPAA